MFVRISRYLSLIVLASPAACDATRLEAVGSPSGDSFRPGAGCAVADLQAAGPTTCMAPAQLGFEQLADGALLEIDEGALSAKAVSCRRTYCGGGALVLHADYRWRPGTTPPASEKLGQLRHRLPAPTNLYGKSLTYALYLDGANTPVNAYVAVIDDKGLFHMVDDGPVLLFQRWTQRGGTIQVGNPRLNLPEGTTTLMVRDILISVYLATEVRAGDREHWAADFYLDQIGWN
jgi:hypothetical protein